MFGIGYQELVIILLIALLFFGGTKIPEIARGLGKGLKEFKKAKDGIVDTINETEKNAENDPKVAKEISDDKEKETKKQS